MAVLRLFASVRVAAGTGKVDVPGATVGDVLADAVSDDDEVALLPPVSGG